MQSLFSLPIDSIKSQIISGIDTASNLIIKASPGSGKTTRVPLFLLEQTDKMIYILEPRRLAAKLAATQVAKELGEEVGERVGYVFRYEKKFSSQTRILFLTEGTFLRILSQDKNLEKVGIIILDEFHERHLSTDAALAFCIKIQSEQRPELKIIIMSATIDTTTIENYLIPFSKTQIIELNAHRFPLNIHYLPNVTSVIQNSLPKKVRNCIENILENDLKGNILIFLPGMKEMRECQTLLVPLCSHYHVQSFFLHGELDSKEQEMALEENAQKKIILATNIAESSVTIPGISIVVDSGLVRESAYNFYSGLPIIQVTKIAKASAIQRAGRANRQNVGHCYRLYAELDYEQRPYFLRPEIERCDLSELYLTVLNIFSLPLNKIAFPETPPIESLKNAHDLLFSLNAIDSEFNITPIGKSLLSYPLHPRLGRILAEAQENSLELYQQTLNFLYQFLNEKNKERFFKQFNINKKLAIPIRPKILEEVLLKGFPDRIARSRGDKHYDLITMNGDTLKISKELYHDFDPRHEFWIVLDLNNKGDVTKCVSIEESWIYDLNPFPIIEDIVYSWDEKNHRITQNSRTLIGRIVLSEDKTFPQISNPNIRKILFDQGEKYLNHLKKSGEYERLLTVNKILHQKNIYQIECSILEDFFNDLVQFNDEDKNFFSYHFFQSLKNNIDPENFFNLEQDFPLSIQLSDKRKVEINYDHTKDPWSQSFIQDFYGITQTPILGKGKLALTLQLLGPHKRVMQVTQDLASFWKNTYPQMYKELSREYPRHHWPENPTQAKPVLLKRMVS